MNESVNYKEYLKNVKSVRKKLLIYLRELEFQLYPEEVYKLTHQEEYLEDVEFELNNRIIHNLVKETIEIFLSLNTDYIGDKNKSVINIPMTNSYFYEFENLVNIAQTNGISLENDLLNSLEDIKDNLKSSNIKDNDELVETYTENEEIPKLYSEAYYEFLDAEPFEFTHSLCYELARRNNDVNFILNFINSTIEEYTKKYFVYGDKNIKEAYQEEDFKIFLAQIISISENNSEIMKDIDYNPETLGSLFVNDYLKSLLMGLIDKLYYEYYIIYRYDNHNEQVDKIYDKNKYLERDSNLTSNIDKIVSSENKNILKTDSFTLVQSTKKNDFIFNKVYQDFYAPIRDFTNIELKLNLNLPKEELMNYLEAIKDNYDSTESSIKGLSEILNNDYEYSKEKIKNMKLEDWHHHFFIFDYMFVNKDKNENTKYEKLKEIFIAECGYLVKKTESEEKADKKNRDNSKYKAVSKEARYSKVLKDKYDNMNQEDIKPYYTSEAIRKKYVFIKKLIDNKIYKKLISGKDGY
ncbi:hypothetical protein N5U55_07010 [Aliarcobacter butzleri]|uniref:hypothetical protein n=2 Tax=Aliarcobacter TaxID=2321111 RepID=UPI0021B31CE1|nr:hypothetical protein [Aliarcobacter butzleri]MCT7583855.1 hypothetical protein [Aliarcobacter butzleri]